MILTKYHVPIKTNRGITIFNTLNGKIISVSEKIYENLYQGKLDFLEKETSDITNLLKNDFLVGSHDKQKDELKKKLIDMKHKNDKLVVTILTNLDCNLGCKYCHENGFKAENYLDIRAQEKVLIWLERQINKNKYKHISIYYYGGEPMLNLEAIENLSKNIKKLCSKHNTKYDFSMTTNGTLFNDESVDRLKAVGVKSIQISIDGPKKIHDERRPFLDGKGSFDIILNSLKKYIDKLKFTVRVNVDKQNFSSIPELMDMIVSENLQNKIDFYLDMVSATHNSSEHCNNYVYTNIEEMKEITYLWKEQVKKGMPLQGKNIIEGLCGNISESNITISPSGELYICPGLCGIEELKIGSTENGFNDFFDKLIDTNVWKDCLDCKYVPMCAGGCRAQAYMSSGSCVTCNCKKGYYDYAVPEYLKSKFKL